MHLARIIKDDKKYFNNCFSSKRKNFGPLYQQEGDFSGDDVKKASFLMSFERDQI